jgi:hypothetical protein
VDGRAFYGLCAIGAGWQLAKELNVFMDAE